MDHTAEKELERVAKLAGLSVEGKEKEILLSDFSRITEYMERITTLDTSSVKDAGSNAASEASCGTRDSLREDIAVQSELPQTILRGAPASDGSSFAVPKTVE